MTEFKPMIIEKEYYSDNTRISNSGTTLFEDSPLTYKEVILDKKEQEDVKAFRKGTMEHMYLLQKEDFWNNYTVLDFQIPKSEQAKTYANMLVEAVLRPIEAFKQCYSTKGMSEAKITSEALKKIEELDAYTTYLLRKDAKEIISFAELQSLKQTEANVKAHKLANKLLKEFTDSTEIYAMSEFHINWTHPATKLPCKSLLDRFIIDVTNKTIYLVDVKTTGSIANFGKSFKEYAYAKQLAWYWMAIEYYIENYSNLNFSEFHKKTYIVAVKNHGNKQVKVINITEEILNAEHDRIQNIMCELQWHYTNSLWEHTKEYYEGDGSETMKITT
jgi:hypothetical protein